MALSLPSFTEVEQFFFKAMLKGWVNNTLYENDVPGMPGYKGFYFRYGSFMLKDVYCSVPYSNKSAGMTSIWHENRLVWTMNYGGLYEKRAIEFLKSMLLYTYEKGIFNGGRGPMVHTQDRIRYSNQFGPLGSNFLMFDGHEEIVDLSNNELLGFHNYSGMSLLF